MSRDSKLRRNGGDPAVGGSTVRKLRLARRVHQLIAGRSPFLDSCNSELYLPDNDMLAPAKGFAAAALLSTLFWESLALLIIWQK